MPAKRYEALDALRGVAALSVVIYHTSEVKLEPYIVPGGYLAVDFFFVLSGFVVALAYEEALQGSMSWKAFFIKRLSRLYPLAFLGALLGVIVSLMKWYRFPLKVDSLSQIIISGFLNCLMLPTVFGGDMSHHDLFPGNGPLWSLFFEMLINMLWAWRGVHIKTIWLSGISLLSGLCLVALAIHYHTANIGFDRATFSGGIARVCFGFPLGVVIFRLHRRVRIPAIGFGPLLLGITLVMLFAFPANAEADGIPWRDLCAILIVLPLIVVLGVGQGAGGRIGALLGYLSYPVYALHHPVLLVVSGLHQTILSSINVHLLSISTIGSVLILGAAAGRFYDEPARHTLSRRLNQLIVSYNGRLR
jgi:peptidoglycan/LPS O-acetylase OafA/YrhL